MVMTSQQIAAQVGAFQQQAMGQMQYAGMLSQYSGNGGHFDPGQMMGGAMNTGAAIGKPLMMGGMALAGMDPIGLGLRAGMGAARYGGFALGGVAGAATGGLAAVGLGAAQYAGTQMFRGAQQQQVLSGQLNSTFRFANQYGGRGFNSGEMRDIGQMMRQMSSQRGPGGEFATMDELGRLAANMGRMGMTQGVKNARDFQRQFQQMLKTVKEVATSLSTSLEEAQKTMSAMVGSGIFGAAAQKQAAGMMRQGVVAGGRTMTEMSQVMNIGSQLSRAVGGRGRAGANAAAEALTRVGAAVKAGVLSEEDIYNQTGQTGAAGMQAMAVGMVQRDLDFYKGTKGRYMLAGLAGKDGRLDKDAVARFMSGKLTTAQVQQMGQQNLARVGRANFIRYEGALRGEAAAAFGGMGGAMTMKGWLESRGLQMNQMNDRNMLLYQRQMGMDREEADNQLKMLQNMPRIQEQREQSMEEDSFMRKVEQSERYKGIQGVKRKLEDARKQINDKLQQAGADFYSEGTNMVEGFINRITGRYVATIDRDLTKTVHEVMKGGAAGRAEAATRLGITSAGNQGLGLVDTALASRGQAAIFGRAGGTEALAQHNVDFMFNNAAAYQKKGWNLMDDAAMRAEDDRTGAAWSKAGMRRGAVGLTLQARLNRMDAIISGGGQTDKEALAAGGALQMRMRQLAVHGDIGTGEAGVNKFERTLREWAKPGPDGKVDEAARAMWDRYRKADSAEQAKIRGSMFEGAGLTRPELVRPEDIGAFESGKFATVSDRHRAIGEYALKGIKEVGADTTALGAATKAVRGLGLFGQAVQGVAGAVGLAAGGTQLISNLFSEGPGRNVRATNEAYGRLVDSEEGRKMSEMVLSRDESTRDAAMQDIARQQEELRKGRPLEELTDAEMAQYQFNRSLMTTAGVNAAVQKAGGVGKVTEETWKELMKQHGAATKEELLARVGSIAGSVKEKQEEATMQYGERAGTISRERMKSYRDLGVVEGEELSKTFREGLSKVGKKVKVGEGKDAKEKSLGELAMESLVAADAARAGMTGARGGVEQTRRLEKLAMASQAEFERRYGEMDVESRKAFQKELRGAGRDALANQLDSDDAVRARMEKGFAKDYDAKTGKATGAYTKRSFYDTVGKELGLKPEDIVTKGNEDKDMENEVFRALTGGADIGGEDTAKLKKLVADLDKARKTRDTSAAQEATKGIQEMDVVRKAQQAKQEAAAEANDPSYRALLDVKNAVTSLGKTILVTRVANADEIAAAAKAAKEEPSR
jgi:hypothetical protein